MSSSPSGTDTSVLKDGSPHGASRVVTNATCSENGTSPIAAEQPVLNKPPLGSILRLKPLNIYDLPTPPLWAKDSLNDTMGPPTDSPYWSEAATNDRPDLVQFIETVLLEGHRFIKEKDHFKSTGEVESKPATVKVEKTKLVVKDKDLRKVDWKSSICHSRRSFKPKSETWFGRRSVHPSLLDNGTAVWNEFQEGLLFNHSEREADYDPSIYDHRSIVDWEPLIKNPNTAFESRFSDISMRIFEMAHNIPVGSPRHFTTLVVSGKVHSQVFITVQIPVNIKKEVPEAFYSNGKNTKQAETQQQRRKTVEGRYVSVESCVHAAAQGTVTWSMTTLSDAGGWLPLWIQKLAMPNAVAKDVGYFMDWVRRTHPRPSVVSRNASRASNKLVNDRIGPFSGRNRSPRRPSI